MRAARKRAGKTQSDVARLLQTSQANVSKLENAMLIPSAPEWFEFCEALQIPVESLRSGILDSKIPVALRSEAQEAGFRLPKRYAESRASTVRGSMPLLDYAIQSLGEDKTLELIDSFGLDTDVLVDLSNQLNLNFFYDLARALVERGHLDSTSMASVGKMAIKPHHHGELAADYQSAQTANEVVAAVIRNAKLYSGNFQYALESRNDSGNHTEIDLSITPQSHLKTFEYRNDPVLGDMICRYQKSVMQNLPSFNGGPVAQVDELECHFRGAERCLLRLKVQNH